MTEVVALGDHKSEIAVVGRMDGAVRPIAVPDGLTKQTFYQIVGAYDTLFRTKGVAPTQVEVQRLIPKIAGRAIRTALAADSFREAMRLRGVGLIETEGLSAQQSATLNILEDFSDVRTLTAKLKAVGATRTQYNAWLKDPLFRKFYESRIESHLRDSHLMALSTIISNAENGDQKAAEKLLEINGRYNPQNAELQNARAVVGAMVEALQRHVKDPEVLKKIIDDVKMAQQLAQITE